MKFLIILEIICPSVNCCDDQTLDVNFDIIHVLFLQK
jgi:hypothetical protein